MIPTHTAESRPRAKRFPPRSPLLVGACIGLLVVGFGLTRAMAQVDENDTANDTTGSQRAATPSDDDVLRNLLRSAKPREGGGEAGSSRQSHEAASTAAGAGSGNAAAAVEAGRSQPPAGVGLPSARLKINPAVLGVAPDQPQPELRREGEFIISRRGRLVRSPEGGFAVFVFAADSAENATQDPPMILQPCRLLENMEDYVDRHGDHVTFVVSGQVHVYRGANYLLPTMMKIYIDRNDL